MRLLSWLFGSSSGTSQRFLKKKAPAPAPPAAQQDTPVTSERFTEKILRIPLRAAIALCSRCARRVQPFTASLSEHDRKTVDLVIQLAEWYARGQSISDSSIDKLVEGALNTSRRFDPNSTVGPATGVAAVSATAAWEATALESIEGRSTRAQAVERVYEIVKSAVILTLKVYYNANDYSHEQSQGTVATRAINRDVDKLMAMSLGSSGESGKGLDPTEVGPLGSLW